MTLEQLFDLYLSKNRNLRSDSTLKSYRIALRHYRSAVGRTPTLSDLSDDNLIQLERYLGGRSAYTINGVLGRIKALWRFAAKRGIVTTWPTLDPQSLPEPHKPTWSTDQVRAILEAARGLKRTYDNVPRSLWWEAYLRCLWDTGERAGAMRACRWDWLEGRLLQIPSNARKGRSKPAVYVLTQASVDAIEQIRKPVRKQIWPWPLCDSMYYTHFALILRKAGLPTDRKSKSQRFRRTHLTMWEAAGHDATSRAMHTNRAVTERFYIDVSKLPQPDPTDILPVL